MSATMRSDTWSGSPRGRLRSHPLPCPLTGKPIIGCLCIGGACPHVEVSECFVDCELLNRQADLATGGGRSAAEDPPARGIVAEDVVKGNSGKPHGGGLREEKGRTLFWRRVAVRLAGDG